MNKRGTLGMLAAVCALSLLVAACGSRLTPTQRAAGIGGLAAGPTTQPGQGGQPLPGGQTTGGPGNPGSIPTAVATDPGIGGGAVPPKQPPGGNGGATDVGVTADKLTIATIADVSGVQPGLFKSAHQAMQAVVALTNSQGGIDGRLLDLKLLDSKIDSGATRAAVLEACHEAFALVGSISAFDNGGAQAVDDCGIPDISSITTTAARIGNKDTFPAYPNRNDYFIIGSANTVKELHPDAIKKAAQLWLNTATTRSSALSKRKAYTSVGFDFVYTAEAQVVESNYTPFVQKMKDNGVKFVTMLSDWQSIARLVDAMRKQQWRPEVLEWDSVVYTPQFIDSTKGAADGSLLYLNSAMFEEVSQYPEMQLYEQWLARVAPGARPDYFGLYAWSAGRLFVETAKKAGPKLTRARLFEEIKKVHAWSDHGMHAPHDVGNKKASQCTMFATIRNGAFVRLTPASGYNCNKGQLYKVT